jgi:hypothetical protein
MTLRKWIEDRRRILTFLREHCDQIGKQFERMSFDELKAKSEENFSYPTQQVNGLTISFFGESRLLKNGDLEYILDLDCKTGHFIFLLPSYRFFKRKDGTIYY